MLISKIFFLLLILSAWAQIVDPVVDPAISAPVVEPIVEPVAAAPVAPEPVDPLTEQLTKTQRCYGDCRNE